MGGDFFFTVDDDPGGVFSTFKVAAPAGETVPQGRNGGKVNFGAAVEGSGKRVSGGNGATNVHAATTLRADIHGQLEIGRWSAGFRRGGAQERQGEEGDGQGGDEPPVSSPIDPVNITEKFTESLIEEKFEDKIKEIYIGTIMEVRLEGNNFKIKKLSNPIQLILKGEETQWNWDVIPLRSGNQLLSLTVSIVITLPNDIKEKKDYYLFDNFVKVKPNLIYSAQIFIDNYWQYFVAMLVGFFMNEFLKKIKNSKKVKRLYVKKP